MQLIALKLLAALAVTIVPLVAGSVPFILKKQNHAYAFVQGEAFACGIFLGAGLLHMLTHALYATTDHNQVMLCVGLSFLTMLLLEHISCHFADHNQNSVPILAIVMLSLHSIAAGIALGMTNSSETLMVVLVAILSHKWAAGFALAVLLVRRLTHVWPAYLIFVAMTPLGILLGHNLLTVNNELVSIYAHATAAGTFLYIGTLHGLKQAVLVDRCCDLKTFIWVVIGFACMAILH